MTTADVNAFILKRQKDVMVVGEDDKREERRYSGEINRELTPPGFEPGMEVLQGHPWSSSRDRTAGQFR